MSPFIIESGRAADRVYGRCLPIAHDDEPAGWPLYALCEALTLPMEPLEDIIRGDDQYGPFERALDVNEEPLWVLPWLACLVGVVWRSPSSERRPSLIRTRPHHRRGTVPAIRAAVQETLIGTRTVLITPRYGGDP